MKKIIAVIIAVTLCTASLFALISCENKPAETTPETTAAQSDATTAEDATESAAESATEAAAETETEAVTETETEAAAETEQTTEAATTAAGGEVEYDEDLVRLFEPREEHTAIDANDGKELACKFTIEKGSRLIGLVFESCPTWMQEGSAFTVELYKWDNDYENTIIGDALYSEEFTDWIDNAECRVEFYKKAETGFDAGTYLWVFRGTANKIGIWAMDPSDECTYFENGVESENGFRVDAIVLSPV